jgi:hypothetical protein
VAAEVELHRIESDEWARRLRFLGSPNRARGGQDVQPGAGSRESTRLMTLSHCAVAVA